MMSLAAPATPTSSNGIVVAQNPAPPSWRNRISYAQQWENNKRIGRPFDCQTVFGSTWHRDYLIACTSNGWIYVWKVPEEEQKGSTMDVDQDDDLVQTSSPVLRVQASKKGILYSIRVVDLNDCVLLLVSGDEGVLVYQWKDFLQRMDGNADVTSSSPPLSPISHYRPHAAPGVNVVVEVNDIDVDPYTSHLYGVVGDAFGGYKWDMQTERLVRNYTTISGSGCLHTVKVLHNASGASRSATVLMGGEEGVLNVWDGHQDQLIEKMNCRSIMNQGSSLMAEADGVDGVADSTWRPWDDKERLWISSVDSHPDSRWWVLCGGSESRSPSGMKGYSYKGGAPPRGGFVALWHAPTRSLVAGYTTRETPQAVRMNTEAMVSVGNECVVSHWSPSQIGRTARTWSSTPSAYALAIQDERVAVGGVGSTINVFDHYTSHLVDLSIM